MKKLMFVTLGVAALAIGSQPVTAQAQVADMRFRSSIEC